MKDVEQLQATVEAQSKSYAAALKQGAEARHSQRKRLVMTRLTELWTTSLRALKHLQLEGGRLGAFVACRQMVYLLWMGVCNSAHSSWHSDFSTSILLRSICISALCSNCVQTRHTNEVELSVSVLLVLSGDTSTVATQGLLTMSFMVKNLITCFECPRT